MNNRVSRYVDTNVIGSLVVQIEHNLDGTVYPHLYTVDGSGHKVVLSLYDPIIAEIKHLDSNITQITFTGAFQGYVDLVFINVAMSSIEARLAHLEKKTVELQEVSEALVNGTQWRQMNTYIFSQMDKLKSDITDLTVQLELVRADSASV